MRTNHQILTLAFCFTLIGLCLEGRSQTYSLSAPITGSLTMGAHNTPANGSSGSIGGYSFNFSNLTETLYLDLTNKTLRTVGVVSGAPSPSNTFTLQETQIVSAVPVSGTMTVSLSLTGSVLTFDTGPRPLLLSNGFYAVSRNTADNFQALGSYVLQTPAQSNIGFFSYTLTNNALGVSRGNVSPTLVTSNYPSALVLGPFTNFFGPDAYSYSKALAQRTNSDGFIMRLFSGESLVSISSYLQWNTAVLMATNVLGSTPPSITAQPTNALVSAHTNVSLSVGATGGPPLNYQWSHNGTNLSGALSSTLTIPDVRQSSLGTYVVVITNMAGSVTSSPAVLDMYPYLANPFTGLDTTWGYTNVLSVTAWGTGPLSYQWYQDGVALAGATNQTLTLDGIQFTNAGAYSVVVTGAFGSVSNTPAQVVVNPAGVAFGLCPSVTITGVVGYDYVVQGASDLSGTNGWSTLATITLTQPVQLWVDTNTDATLPANPRRFYRVLPGQ